VYSRSIAATASLSGTHMTAPASSGSSSSTASGARRRGHRQVFTYTELITDEGIEEYVNDETDRLPAQPARRHPGGHISNIPVSAAPGAWPTSRTSPR